MSRVDRDSSSALSISKWSILAELTNGSEILDVDKDEKLEYNFEFPKIQKKSIRNGQEEFGKAINERKMDKASNTN